MFYVIEYWQPQFHKETLAETLKAVLNITQGGLVVFGSLIGGAVAALIFLRVHRLPALAMGDVLTPSLVLGMAIGRIGCFFNGCCFGGECDLPWALRFPWGSPPFAQQVEQGKLSLHGLYFRGHADEPPIIDSVEPGSPADNAGVLPGQSLTRIAAEVPDSDRVREWNIQSTADAQAALLHITGEGTQIRLDLVNSGDSQPQSVRWTIPAALPRSNPVHPTQIYSAIDGFLMLFVLLAFEPFQRRSGALLRRPTLHPVSRILLEEIRKDEAGMFGTRWSISRAH